MNVITYPKDWASRIATHYVKAVMKHPHFADVTFCKDTLTHCREQLALCREILAKEEAVKNVYAEDLLLEELWEVAEAVGKNSAANAVDEIYDAVAVLLRMAYMIENGGAK